MHLIGIQALIPAYQFSCNGTLVEWRVATVRKGQHNIELQVWRQQDQTQIYHIVGHNTFNVRPKSAHQVVSLIPNSKNLIKVQKGDTIGFYLENNKNITNDFSIQYQPNTHGISVNYRQLSYPARIINYSTLPVELLGAAPIIHAEIGKILKPISNTTLAGHY